MSVDQEKNPLQPRDWNILVDQIPRRELLTGSGKVMLLLYLAEFGGLKAAQSPLGIFLLSQPDTSTIPTQIALSPGQTTQVLIEGEGSSYIKGEGGISPVLLVATQVSDSGVGDWVGIEEAVSGSLVSGIPEQVIQLQEKIPASERRGRTRLLVTDSGYNSVASNTVGDPSTFASLQYILERLSTNRIGIWDIPGIIKRLNEVCDAFLHAIDSTESRLIGIDTAAIQTLAPYGVYLYTFPPLERVPALVHIATSDNPKDHSYSIPIRGDRIREFVAEKISTLGSNMAGRVARRLQQNTGVPIVLIDLRNILGVEDYQRGDEHPNASSWMKIANQQMQQTSTEDTTLLKLVRNRTT